MNAEDIIAYIAASEKKTPVKVYLKMKDGRTFEPCAYAGRADVRAYGTPDGMVVFADWSDASCMLSDQASSIEHFDVEFDRRNSGVPLLDTRSVNARIEPGAIIRDRVEIGDNAVIMMGAIINIGSVVGEGTMIDMGCVLGGRAIVGKRCHIGAGTVLAGVVEPASATPVVIEDDVMIGANAVVLEGCRVGAGSVVAAGAVVVSDVAPGSVVAGIPAKVIKMKDGKTESKTALVDALRTL